MSEEGVTYTVKELIGRLDAKLDIISGQVGGKLAEVEKRVATLEAEGIASKAVAANTRWIVYTAIPCVAGMAAIITRAIA